MSFSSEVKDELVSHSLNGKHCQIAELTALLLMNHVMLQPNIVLKTENYRVAKRMSRIIYHLYRVPCEIKVSVKGKIRENKGVSYQLFVKQKDICQQILQDCKITEPVDYDPLVTKKDCCKRAFIRGAFLSTGSVNSPETSYHFELSHEKEALLMEIDRMFAPYQIHLKIVKRKKQYVAYLKDGDAIADALKVMEALQSMFKMEDIRIYKSMNNKINRNMNCDMANINKIVGAARGQIEDIEYLMEIGELTKLSESLQEIAQLRISEPGLSLKELGELANPPISKSGVNHRLKKLGEIAYEIRLQSKSTMQNNDLKM